MASVYLIGSIGRYLAAYLLWKPACRGTLKDTRGLPGMFRPMVEVESQPAGTCNFLFGMFDKYLLFSEKWNNK